MGFWWKGRGEVGSYHCPPMSERRSKTRITSKACSLARASVAMAPDGPAPMTATRRALKGIFNKVMGVDVGMFECRDFVDSRESGIRLLLGIC